ncbi:MAG: glycosyltransferase family 2 protein [Bacteroidota bacterium]
MLNNLKIVVVMPAYNAAATIEKTFNEIPFDIVDEVILTDDASNDNTLEVAKKIGIKHIFSHQKNKGYGGNQKTCYDAALNLHADIIIMIHPDYQYTPKLIRAMASLISEGVYDVVIGSRILGKGALSGGMPMYKYFFNRVLTFVQNILMGQKLSEYHSGYRAFKSTAILKTNYTKNSDDFVFDNQILAQIIYNGYEIAEITCPTRYEKDSSSINFSRSLKYGLGCMQTALLFFLAKRNIYTSTLFK